MAEPSPDQKRSWLARKARSMDPREIPWGFSSQVKWFQEMYERQRVREVSELRWRRLERRGRQRLRQRSAQFSLSRALKGTAAFGAGTKGAYYGRIRRRLRQLGRQRRQQQTGRGTLRYLRRWGGRLQLGRPGPSPEVVRPSSG